MQFFKKSVDINHIARIAGLWPNEKDSKEISFVNFYFDEIKNQNPFDNAIPCVVIYLNNPFLNDFYRRQQILSMPGNPKKKRLPQMLEVASFFRFVI